MRKGKGMKKRIISKILTLLVVFSMVFTLLPVNNKIVHAGDGKVNIGDYIYLGTYQGKKIKWVSALSKGGFSMHTNPVIMIARC